jgi:hypothetical protein
MNRSLIQGVEVTKQHDRLIIRNSWSPHSLGGHALLVVGVGFFGCSGFLGLVSVKGESSRDQVIGTVMAAVGIPLAILGVVALLLRTLRHCRPFVLDRKAGHFLDGRQKVCSLRDIRTVSVEECGSDPTEYVVRFVLADGSMLHTLEQRIDEFRSRKDPEHLVAEITDFLSVGVAEVR